MAVLAVLKAGAAFLPLNPRLPRAQLKGMLAMARPRWLLLQEAGLEDLAPGSTSVLRLDHIGPEVALQPADNLPATATATNAAYAIFTSGSTGEPKAVVAIHRALVNATVAVTRIHGTSERDRRLAFVPIGSDVVIAEIFNTLSCGATLVYGSGTERGSVGEFLRVLKEQRITITGIPSSWWHEWVAAAGDGEGAIPDSLRLVVAGIERVHPSALVAWKRLCRQPPAVAQRLRPYRNHLAISGLRGRNFEMGRRSGAHRPGPSRTPACTCSTARAVRCRPEWPVSFTSAAMV